MPKKPYPTNTELEHLWWYRLGKVILIFIVIAALFAPAIFEKGLWYFDGVISATIWFIVLVILGRIILYVIYGKIPNTEDFKKDKRKRDNKIAIIIFIAFVYLFIMWLSLSRFHRDFG